MCGIAGVVNSENMDLNRIAFSLKHRGPDEQTIYQYEQVALIHTRLAIQDVEHGTQPFHFENLSIIFNGEIYNHRELRSLLTEFTFKTNSDTETLLYLYIKYKEKMYSLLDGMFAFCIYDKLNNQLILARDRAGKKPLYYYQEKQFFIFASELNAIKAITPLTISDDAINCYLRTGYVWRPHTAYNDVYELDAGVYLIISLENLNKKIYSYFNLLDHYNNKNEASFQQTLHELERRLKQSIHNRIVASDVDVGVFLSGGIDSNLIAAMASEVRPNIKTFTVKFEGLYDESHLARLTANKYHTNHIELTISTQLEEDIERILSAYGEPFMDSSAIPSYYVSHEASKHVKVILGGDGADELFGGYRRYIPAAYSLAKFFENLSPLFKILPKPNNKQSFYNYLFRLIAMSKKQGLDYYLSATTDIFEDNYSFENNPIISQFKIFIDQVLQNKNLSSLKQMLFVDFSALLFCDLLVKMDIASMANSLEVRSPFLSKYLLEFVPGLPDNFKICKLKTKYILRKLAEQYLPQALINQPKRGFEVPLKRWVDFDLKEKIQDALIGTSYVSKYVQKDFVTKLLKRKIPVSNEKRAKMLWTLFCLEIWFKNEGRYSYAR